MQARALISPFLNALLEAANCKKVSLLLPKSVLANSQTIVESTAGDKDTWFSLDTDTRALFIKWQDDISDALNSGLSSCVVPSGTADVFLLALDIRCLDSIEQNREKPRGRRSDSLELGNLVWFAFDYRKAETAPEKASKKPLPGELASPLVNNLCCLLCKCLLEKFVNQAILQDPDTELIGRFQLQQMMENDFSLGHDQILFLVNPKDFEQINTRFGRAAGDKVIRAFAERLRKRLRHSDIVGRYGGATFAILVKSLSLEVAHSVATSLHQYMTETPYLEGAVALDVDIGMAQLNAASDIEPTEQALQLLNRAEQALNVAKSNEDTGIATWHESLQMDFWRGVDRLGGIFTAKPKSDYRNMLLLWDIVEIVASENQIERLTERFLKRLYETFATQKIAVVNCDVGGDWQMGNGLVSSADLSGQPEITRVGMQTEPAQWIDDLVLLDSEAMLKQGEWLASDGQPRRSLLLPMIAAEQLQGVLYFEGRAEQWTITQNDQRFLLALAMQLASGLTRLKMQARLEQQQEIEKQQLKEEVRSLRATFEESRFVYASPLMERLLKRTHRIAASSATVLITGESGTGKELLAETVHQLGPRSHKPMVVVDCSAIPHSLLESELFGHIKGAFTGATQSSKGRILEASGGTLILDEIGELPLSLQAKFLRFVQEKEITPVGGKQPVTADVTLVAVTNRDLAQEAAEGKFREDLYYRLNVMVLKTPPLRDRLEDIPVLMQHFAKRFARQFQMPQKQITPELCEKLQSYSWPGNVRELQNRMMQAVILSEQELKLADFELPLDLSRKSPLITGKTDLSGENATTIKSVSSTVSTYSNNELWQLFADQFEFLCDALVAKKQGIMVAPAVWIEHELVVSAYLRVNKVARSAARILGIPATTMRRKLQRAQRTAAPQEPDWQPLKATIAAIVAEVSSEDAVNLLEKAETEMTRRLCKMYPEDPLTASELMGVGEATYKRRVKPILAEAQS